MKKTNSIVLCMIVAVFALIAMTVHANGSKAFAHSSQVYCLMTLVKGAGERANEYDKNELACKHIFFNAKTNDLNQSMLS